LLIAILQIQYSEKDFYTFLMESDLVHHLKAKNTYLAQFDSKLHQKSLMLKFLQDFKIFFYAQKSLNRADG